MLLFFFLRRTSKSPILLPEYHQFHFPEEQTSCCNYFLCSTLVQERVVFHFLQFDAFWLKCNRNSYSSTVRTDISGTNILVKHLQGAEKCINGYTVIVTAIMNQMQCIRHTPLSITQWVYINQTLKPCINVLIAVECYSPFVVSPCSQYRSYKANFCGLSTTLNFFRSALITSCVVVSLKQSNDCLITSRYDKQVHA